MNCGVALVRLAATPHGCGDVEEFYAVVFEGHIFPKRFATYAEAFRHVERLLGEARADVA